MSTDALDVLRQHRDATIQLSPFSELFQIVGGVSFYGVFDEAHVEENKDAGQVTQKKRKPLIMVSEVPSGLVERTSKITREGETREYTFHYVGKDAEGLPILWLF
jgi:hypothetical protein